ncbi:MAG: hypothetical protein ABIH11_03690 [Candidatus Altiarchaeota archaeon]
MSLVKSSKSSKLALVGGLTVKKVAPVIMLLLASTGFMGYELGNMESSIDDLREEIREVFVCADGKRVGDISQCITTVRDTTLHVTSTIMRIAADSGGETTMTNAGVDLSSYILSPGPGCYCERWNCPTSTTTSTTTTITTTTTTSTTSTTTSTTTTCVTIPFYEYQPRERHYWLVLKEEEFEPNRIEAFIGDTAIVILETEKGLYKIRDPINDVSILLRPGEKYILTFKAEESGEFPLSCTEFCEKPVKAEIIVFEPYKVIC